MNNSKLAQSSFFTFFSARRTSLGFFLIDFWVCWLSLNEECSGRGKLGAGGYLEVMVRDWKDGVVREGGGVLVWQKKLFVNNCRIMQF